MKTIELANQLGCQLLTPEDTAQKEVQGCYLCDFLSYAMSRASRGDAWITIMTNVNIVAVALLTEVACIILPEDNAIDEAVAERATAEGVAILKSSKTAYQLAVEMSKILDR